MKPRFWLFCSTLAISVLMLQFMLLTTTIDTKGDIDDSGTAITIHIDSDMPLYD